MKARPRTRPPRPARSRPARKPAPAIDIDANRQLLNRYRYIEHEGLRLLAGWLPRVATFELKCELGRSILSFQPAGVS